MVRGERNGVAKSRAQFLRGATLGAPETPRADVLLVPVEG